MATAETPDTAVAVLQRIRAGWLPHKLAAGGWWWGRPRADDGFRLWHQGLVPSMSIVDPMTDDEIAVWTASLHPYAPECCSGSLDCPAAVHVHGCYADFGQCDAPQEHRAGGSRD